MSSARKNISQPFEQLFKTNQASTVKKTLAMLISAIAVIFIYNKYHYNFVPLKRVVV